MKEKEPDRPGLLHQITSRLIQAGLWLALPTLLLLFTLYSVESQRGFLYNCVRETPIERHALHLLPYLWRHKTFLERQSMNANLSTKERMASKKILQRMERIRPTHSIHLLTGDFIFGRPSGRSSTELAVNHYPNKRLTKTVIKTDQIKVMQALAMEHGEFSPRNIRFLLTNSQMQHYYLHPYLFASETSFKPVMEIFAILSLLEESFRTHFGPLIDKSRNSVVQVAYFSTQRTLAQQTATMGIHSTLNASAFFHKSDDTLFLCRENLDSLHSAHMFQSVIMDPITDTKAAKHSLFRLIRHEGAHHLANSLGVLEGLGDIPFWLEEGLAQYCETAPFTVMHDEKITYLRQAAATAILHDIDTLLSTSLNAADSMRDKQLQTLYAQSWLLFHYLMQKDRRPKFFSFLLALKKEGHWQAHHKISLANCLNTTWEKIDTDLRRALSGPDKMSESHQAPAKL